MIDGVFLGLVYLLDLNLMYNWTYVMVDVDLALIIVNLHIVLNFDLTIISLVSETSLAFKFSSEVLV